MAGAAAAGEDEDEELLPLMFSFRPIVADEETIILRRFEVSVSEETNEEQGPPAAAELADELEANEAIPEPEPPELALLEFELADLANSGCGGGSIAAGLLLSFCCCCLLIELELAATTEAALALAGITGLAFASAIW